MIKNVLTASIFPIRSGTSLSENVGLGGKKLVHILEKDINMMGSWLRYDEMHGTKILIVH